MLLISMQQDAGSVLIRRKVRDMGERTEALMRIVVCIISGIILGLWKGLVQILGIIHWIIIIFSGKRLKGIAEFSEIWNS
ncbi:DUF4389 domain-containing protein, partial [Candidatus Woesearchaeota archaeon]|nr:DUF4389 domain-containing protein [Candidatus Woesearchaeota archaeon]